MCDLCGLLWCAEGCPNYRAAEDPLVMAVCPLCGEAIDEDEVYCVLCKEGMYGDE